MLHFSHSIFSKNIAYLAVTREHYFAFARKHAPKQWLNELHFYKTMKTYYYYGKVVTSLIQNNAPIAFLIKILIVSQLKMILVSKAAHKSGTLSSIRVTVYLNNFLRFRQIIHEPNCTFTKTLSHRRTIAHAQEHTTRHTASSQS